MTKISPEAALHRHILEQASQWDETIKLPELLTEKQIYDFYEECRENHLCDTLYEARENIRETGEETGISSDNHSRHYESEEVAAKMSDGTWVGWTYWHGGGKHGEPAAIDWIGDAYYLSCEEKEVLTIQRTWTKI